MNNAASFRPAAAIFDMDGLMLDSEGPVIPLWGPAGRAFGWDIFPEMVHRIMGMNEDGMKAFFLHEFGPEFPYPDVRRELMRLLIETFERDGIACKPGLLTLLDHLDALDIPFGVATSTDRKTAFWKLEKAGIRDRFTVLTCGDEIKNGKPAPDIFLKAAEKLGSSPAACVGFEDSSAGLMSLNAAGIRSVFIKDQVEPSAEIIAGVWRRCADLAEAVPLFL
jgi:HAD superfamily hydrolase (TIGR01509 family)